MGATMCVVTEPLSADELHTRSERYGSAGSAWGFALLSRGRANGSRYAKERRQAQRGGAASGNVGRGKSAVALSRAAALASIPPPIVERHVIERARA